MQCAIQEVDELDQVVEQFYEFAAAQSYVVWGPLIVIEKSYLSLFSNNQLHYELQTLIEPVVKSEGGYEHDCSADND